jgi:hypothetical protein
MAKPFTVDDLYQSLADQPKNQKQRGYHARFRENDPKKLKKGAKVKTRSAADLTMNPGKKAVIIDTAKDKYGTLQLHIKYANGRTEWVAHDSVLLEGATMKKSELRQIIKEEIQKERRNSEGESIMKNSELRQIIREMIDEIDFKDQSEFDTYKSKHKMRDTTKVRVAGKDTTAGEASGNPKSIAGKRSKPNPLLAKFADISDRDIRYMDTSKKEKVLKSLNKESKVGLKIANKLVTYQDNIDDSRRELYGVIPSDKVGMTIANKYGLTDDYGNTPKSASDIVYPKDWTDRKIDMIKDMTINSMIKKLPDDMKAEYEDEIKTFSSNHSKMAKLFVSNQNELNSLDLYNRIARSM